MGGLVILGLLVTLALLAPRYGVDLRDSSDWRSQRDQTLAARGVRCTVKGDAVAFARWSARAGRRLAEAWRRQERAWDALWQAYQPWRGGDRAVRPADDPGGREQARHRDELRWRHNGDAWYLDGRLLPSSPATGDPSSEPTADHE